MTSRDPIIEKWSLNTRKLTRIRNTGIIQFQFFRRCTVDTTEVSSLMVNATFFENYLMIKTSQTQTPMPPITYYIISSICDVIAGAWGNKF